jgi:hypothetical protein
MSQGRYAEHKIRLEVSTRRKVEQRLREKTFSVVATSKKWE